MSLIPEAKRSCGTCEVTLPMPSPDGGLTKVERADVKAQTDHRIKLVVVGLYSSNDPLWDKEVIVEELQRLAAGYPVAGFNPFGMTVTDCPNPRHIKVSCEFASLEFHEQV